MKVHELITELRKFPQDHDVHLDVSNSDDQNWEGDRVVRHVAGVREQQGHDAVAIDALSYADTHAVGF